MFLYQLCEILGAPAFSPRHLKKYLTRHDIQGWIAYNNLHGTEHQHRHFYGALTPFLLACAHSKKGIRPKWSKFLYESPAMRRRKMLKVQSTELMKNLLLGCVAMTKPKRNPGGSIGGSKLKHVKHRKNERQALR